MDKVKPLGGNVLENAVNENAREVAAHISASRPILKHSVDEKNLVVLPAYYDLETGVVSFLK